MPREIASVALLPRNDITTKSPGGRGRGWGGTSGFFLPESKMPEDILGDLLILNKTSPEPRQSRVIEATKIPLNLPLLKGDFHYPTLEKGGGFQGAFTGSRYPMTTGTRQRRWHLL